MHSATDTFLLIATEDSIYHLPVPDVSSSTSQVQAIPIGVVGQIETLAYDPNKRNVLYTDSTTRSLHRYVDSFHAYVGTNITACT